MAKSSIAKFVAIIAKLRKDRQKHLTALAEIDATLSQLGIAVEPAAPAVRRGRPKGSGKKAGKRKRGTFSETAEQFILGLVKEKSMTSAEINKAWKSADRAGLANNTLTKMVKAKALKRAAVEGERGGSYSAV